MNVVKMMFRTLWQTLPESEWKRRVKMRYILHQRAAWVTELAKVPIVGSGCESLDGRQIPYVVVEDGLRLNGRWPTEFERELYSYWRQYVTPAVTEDTIRVAMDVVLRYQYPHAMPHLTMPYSLKNRRYFHLQHADSIDDLPTLSRAEKDLLKEIYRPQAGESFLDVGAYMGYGAIRLSQQLGPAATVIAVEADPDARWLLEQNIQCNNLTTIAVIPKAVWDQDGLTLHFHKSHRQANSLVASVVTSSEEISVQTTTVDTILHNAGIECVDIVSITINGAEVEAVAGMTKLLKQCPSLRLSIAGWYHRGNRRVCDVIAPKLKGLGLHVAVGKRGRVFAWR